MSKTRTSSPIEESNFLLFRDILSSLIIEKCAPSSSRPTRNTARKAKAGRKTAIKPVSALVTTEEAERNDAEELGDFIDYLANEIFASFTAEIRNLTYQLYITTPSLFKSILAPSTTTILLNNLPVSIAETLETYELLAPNQTPTEFLTPVLNTYLTTLTTAPPPPSQTKGDVDGCEICERSWIPLTYHHLIPRSVHAKVIKRGWHPESDLNNVAWLCRACHSFVHRVASAEELAKEFYTVEQLVKREDVQAFAKWVGGVRWKSR